MSRKFIGLLWQETQKPPRSLVERVTEAGFSFLEKTDLCPTHVQMHPNVAATVTESLGLTIIPTESVGPTYLYVGTYEEDAAPVTSGAAS